MATSPARHRRAATRTSSETSARSNTYEWLVEHLAEGVDGGKGSGGWPYEDPCWVFTSRSLPALPGADLRFVQGDVRPVHKERVGAAGGRNLWIAGGGELVGQFHDHGSSMS